MDSISFFWSFFKMLVALAAVIALMIGAMYIIKKYFYQAPAATPGNAMIRVISSHYIGPRASIMLIEVLGQFMLLGVSDHQMSMLATITDPAALEHLRNAPPKESAFSASGPLSQYKSLLENIKRVRKGR